MLWEEYADGSLSIYQNVICEKNSQKVVAIIADDVIIWLIVCRRLLLVEKVE